MPPVNCEINLILTWYGNCLLISGNNDAQVPTFAITDTNIYVPVVILSTQENVKLLDQLKSGSKRAILLEQISIKSNNTGTKPILRLSNLSTFSGSK